MEDILAFNPSYTAFEETPFHKAIDDDENYGKVTKLNGNETFTAIGFKRVWFHNKNNKNVAAITHKNMPYVILDDDNGKSINDFIEDEIDIELPIKGDIIYSKNPREIISKKGERITIYEVHIKGWKFSDFKLK